jgi:heat shock protein HtpX
VPTDFEATDLFAQQDANRRKSRWVVALFVLFFVWLGVGADVIRWLAGPPDRPFGLPWFGLALGLVAGGMLWYARRHGPDRVLWSAGAWQLLHPATPEQQRYVNVVEEMAIAASLPVPTLWIIEDQDPNAFATGMRPEAAHVAVTTGLLEALDRDELQGVIAHELGHIKNLDTQLMTLLAALVGAVLLMRDGIGRMLRHGGRAAGRAVAGGARGGGRGGKNAGGLVALLLVVWLISWVLAPLVLQLLSMWVSRKREYLADAMAAQFTRNPLALASALEKVHASHSPTHAIQAGVAHLCIADPLGRRLEQQEGALADLFATHPPMALRIARLRAMGFQELKRNGQFPAPADPALPPA